MSIYYNGGLAELVSNPTPLTYSFFKNWFTGKGSLGIAMLKLGLPYEKVDIPVLELVDNELVVNLKSEEQTLYTHTVFVYDMSRKLHDTPKLKISFAKALSMTNVKKTLSLFITQTKWISNPQKSVDLCRKLVDSIPDARSSDVLEKLDHILMHNVWPKVIAIGLLNEFYMHVALQGKNDQEKIALNHAVDEKSKNQDWFYRSIADQELVNNGEMSFKEYLNLYGIRADNDYEITSPRWHEIPDVIKKRIAHLKVQDHKHISGASRISMDKLADTIVELRILRSEAKQKALIHFDQLRKTIRKEAKTFNDLNQWSRLEQAHDLPQVLALHQRSSLSRKGNPVSQGIAKGTIVNVTSHTFTIPPNTIGIFPNASPEYTTLFPQCRGIIFKKGGITSHGAIVTREFKIPAIVDPEVSIEDGIKVELNGSTGKWRIIH